VADREKLQLYKPTPATETIRVKHDGQLMGAYALVDDLRRGTTELPREVAEQALTGALDHYPSEWLLRADMLDLPGGILNDRLRTELIEIGRKSKELGRHLQA
jgi:phenylalanine-4-hydroxylase